MEYRTVRDLGTDEFTEKRSRFIGHCRPVITEEQAQRFLEDLRARYWDASHNVYAYILRSGVQRFSDDGEPQGTGGVPMLEILRKGGLTDVMVVATRYFGGILLGGGGLVRAYGHTASIAVRAAGVVRMVDCALLRLTCAYGDYGRVQGLIPAAGGAVDASDFTDRVTLQLHIPPEALPGLTARLADATGGRCTLTEEGRDFFPFDDPADG